MRLRSLGDSFSNSSWMPFFAKAISSTGVGYANVDLDGDEDDSVFAYQVGAGIGYAVSDQATIDLKYRYFATEDPDFGGVDAEVASHNIYLGIRVNF